MWAYLKNKTSLQFIWTHAWKTWIIFSVELPEELAECLMSWYGVALQYVIFIRKKEKVYQTSLLLIINDGASIELMWKSWYFPGNTSG